MYMAHILYKKRIEERTSMIAYDPQQQWKNALKRAWYFIRFRKALADGVVTFSFWKKDGTIREAHGTRRLLAIPHDSWPKGMRKASPSVLTFYDLNKGAWRCLRRTSLLGWFEVDE